MNLSTRLIEVIGSPYAPAGAPPSSVDEAGLLYEHAVKNKIALLYLQTLQDRGRLDDFGLVSQYENEVQKHQEQRLTARRFADRLRSLGIDYAVYKTVMPYPATPSDVDIVYFGPDKQYNAIVQSLCNSGYDRVAEVPSPAQVLFHDGRDGPHTGGERKDVYDSDLYREIGSSHVVYLDKGKLKEHIVDFDLLGKPIKMLDPAADLMAIIAHSVIPTQLSTLFVQYATLYYLKGMSPGELKDFISLVKRNNVTVAARAHLSITAALHAEVFGSVPAELQQSLGALGREERELSIFRRNEFKMPHRYSMPLLIRSLLEKSRERRFSASIVRQMLSMSSPRLFRWVVWNMVNRRRRETC